MPKQEKPQITKTSLKAVQNFTDTTNIQAPREPLLDHADHDSSHQHSHDGEHGEHQHEVGHSHDHTRNTSRKALLIALIITGSFLVVELVVGFLINSLALIADAGHMLTDALALGLGLAANLIASRRPTAQKTFGYSRFEILSAFFNALTLVVIALYIFWEAFHRWNEPAEVQGVWLMGVAVAGLIANLASGFILLKGGSKDNMNVRAAMLHVWGDALGSIGAIVAGLIILLTGWYQADTIVSVLIGFLILFSSLRLLRESVNILLEATPIGIDISKIEQAMLEVPGVQEVHDLHVWMISNGFVALSGHVTTDGHHFNSSISDQSLSIDGNQIPRQIADICTQICESHQLLIDLNYLLEERFAIQHITLQIEERSMHNSLNNRCYQKQELS